MKIITLITILTFPFCGAAADLYPPDFSGIFDQYEKRPLELIARFLPDDPVILEAGAYNGNDSLKFNEEWPDAIIHSFEPNPHAFEQLVTTTWNIPNINTYNLALSTYNGSARFNVCWGSTGDNPIFEGASSLLPSSDWMRSNYRGPQIDVPCAVLDDWCKKNDVDHIDFMWLDMEGMELQVLKSSPQILKTVKVIYTETNFQEFRQGMTQYKDLSAFLKKAGFQLLVHWYIENFKGQGNAIFVRVP